jgi:hypothetical protein
VLQTSLRCLVCQLTPRVDQRVLPAKRGGIEATNGNAPVEKTRCRYARPTTRELRLPSKSG